MKLEEVIIGQLYEKFQKQGYLTEEDIYELCETYNLSFVKTDYVGNQLLAKGVLISDGVVTPPPEENSEKAELTDFAQINYEEVYRDILKECPGLVLVVAYAKRVTPPQKGELKQLFVQVKSGNQYARGALIKKYIRAALRFTLHYREKTSIPLDDIFSVAMIGVMKAIDSYDPYTNSYFSSYVTWWMKQNVDRYISDHESVIRLPVHFIEKIKKVKQSESLYQDLSEDDAINQIAMELDTNHSEAELIYRQLAMEPHASIEEILENDGELATYESLYLEPSIEEIIEQRADTKQIAKAIATLPPKERQVIELRYGFADGSIWTLEEVGQLLSVTRERVRQIESKALKNLKHPSRAKYFSDLMKSKDKKFSPRFKLTETDGKPYYSNTPGTISGNSVTRIYGKISCTSTMHSDRPIYFADEKTAIAVGYRPCPICMKDKYEYERIASYYEQRESNGADYEN